MKIEESHVGLGDGRAVVRPPIRVLTKAWSNLECLVCREIWDAPFALVDRMRAHLAQGKEVTIVCPKCGRLHVITQFPNAVVIGVAEQ